MVKVGLEDGRVESERFFGGFIYIEKNHNVVSKMPLQQRGLL